MTNHMVSGAGGVALHVSEHGNSTGAPILFVHGWSQSELCWMLQYSAEALAQFRLLGLDLRGHGMSARPAADEDFADADIWADDVAAVVDALDLRELTLVGWSYGGLVVCDYLRRYPDAPVRAINFVGAVVATPPGAVESPIGPAFKDHLEEACGDDLGVSIDAIRAKIDGMAAASLPPEIRDRFLAFNMVVPPSVRAATLKRQSKPDWTVGRIRQPVLATHGAADRVVLPASSDYIVDTCPAAKGSRYPATGHMPFVEAPERFNRELAEFANAA